MQLNVTDSENYFIEYMDGSYTYNLPRSWHDGVEKVINGSGEFELFIRVSDILASV